MAKITDMNRLCRLIVYVVNRTCGLAQTGLFVWNSQTSRYELAAVRYPSLFPPELAIEQQDPVIKALGQTHGPLAVEERNASNQLAQAYTWMRKFEVRLLVPAFSNGRLLAFLALGAPRSHKPFTRDDLAVFSTLATQAALAIEQARFFEDLKAHEASLIQWEKWARLGQLASGIVHDLHNPLTIISGEAQLYLERHQGKDPEVDRLMHSIIEECERVADLTKRILRFAKPHVQEVGPVDVRTTVEESLQLVSYQLRVDRIERRVEIPDNLPKVRGNSTQLQAAFVNLIVSACQAMSEQGGRLSIVAAQKDGQVELVFSDTGPGSAPSTRSGMVDPFSTAASNGTPLGLFVSQRIIQAHNGSIEARSTEGGGTTVVIRLPVAPNG